MTGSWKRWFADDEEQEGSPAEGIGWALAFELGAVLIALWAIVWYAGMEMIK